VALHGAAFLGGGPFGPLRRPRRVPGDLTTFRAAGRELGRCDVERGTQSATVGPEIIKHTVALTLVTPSTPGAGHDDSGLGEASAARTSSLAVG
jgi:hypothetical protein